MRTTTEKLIVVGPGAWHRIVRPAAFVCALALAAAPCLAAVIVLDEDADSIPAAPGGVFVWDNPNDSINSNSAQSLAQTFQVDSAFTGHELLLGYDRYRALSAETAVVLGVAVHRVADTLADILVLGDEIFSDVINLNVAIAGEWSSGTSAARVMALQFHRQNRPTFEASVGSEGYALVITWEAARQFQWFRGTDDYGAGGRSYVGTASNNTSGGTPRQFAMAIYKTLPDAGTVITVR